MPPSTVTVKEGKHTAGALRAAKGIDNICGGVAGLPTDFLSRRTRENAIAELISSETHDAELLEALEQAFLMFGRMGGNTAGGSCREGWLACRAAIEKAKGDSHAA